MSRYSLNPDRLFDRPWRPGHPFRPKTGRCRRFVMLGLLALLCGVIWSYGYVTEPRRVRAMAEAYLSNLVGGRVTVGGASLSLFEGLRLDAVEVYVDADYDPAAATSRPDALLFSARTFVIQYDPASMVRGQLQATQIVVEKPHVRLCRDAATDAWNFHRLGSNRRPRPAPAPGAPAGKPMPLPELLLRNARVEVAELRGGRDATLGYMAIDGQLSPQASTDSGGHDRYTFVLQSRGLSDAMGPLVTGAISLDTGRVTAQLKQFEFGRDVRAMLPADVGAWWERHELGGRVDVPVVEYVPPREGRPPRFRIETVLNGVNLSIPPEEWMSGTEVARREDAKSAAGMIRGAFAMAGFGGAAGQAWAVPGGPAAGDVDVDAAAAGTDRAAIDPRVPVPPWASSRAVAAPRANPAAGLAALLDTTPIQLRQVAGSFVFTEQGVDVRGLSGRVENNLLAIDGHIDGYRPESPLAIRVASAASEDLHIPASPRYVWSLPPGVREVYEKVRPQGTCRLQLDVARKVEGGAVAVGGSVDLLDASFVFDEFPYPVRQTHGRIELARDETDGRDWILFKGLRGFGVAGGPNADRQLAVDGWIGPIGPVGFEPGGQLKIRAGDVTTEPALSAAFDRDVSEALALFDAPGKGQYPRFRGDAVVEVYKDVGAVGKFKVRVDLDLREAEAMLVDFPYPLRKVSGKVRIRDGYCDVVDVRAAHPTATLAVNGRVAWSLPNAAPGTYPAGRRTDLKVSVRQLPVDADLLTALPPDAAEWVGRAGLAGRVDVDGRLTGPDQSLADGRHPPSPTAAAMPTVAGEGGRSARPGRKPDALDYTFDVSMRDGALKPRGSDYAVTGVAGRLRLTPDRVDLLDLTAARRGATLTAVGQAGLDPVDPRLLLVVTADNLPLDRELYSLLPASARSAWDEVRPTGTIDGEITFARLGPASDDRDGAAAVGGAGDAATALVAVVDLAQSAAGQATRPSGLVLDLPAAPGSPAVTRELPVGLHATLRPRQLSASLATLPYPLEQVAGEVVVRPERVELRGVTARHGKATLAVSGTGLLWPQPTWTLAIAAKDLPADAELRHALPASLAGLLDAVKLTGTLGVDLDKFVYRTAPTQASAPGDTRPAAGPEFDLAGRITLGGASMDAGVTLDQIRGGLTFSAGVRRDRLDTLTGRLDVDSLDMGGREVTGLRAAVDKVAGQQELSLTRLQAAVGGGDLAGQATLGFPDVGPARYSLGLFLRNADVKELAREAGENVAGRVTASLAVEGAWGKAAARRGRGDVVVTGKEMYRIPVMLGMMQVTNLALPISSPFSNATARYSLDGDRVNFERVELRSNNMVMTGDGFLDFATKQVRMTFVTDNAAGFKVPFLQDLWRGAQQELLRIHVRGTVQDPTVENRPFGTFTTTVDEVFKGDQPKKGRK